MAQNPPWMPPPRVAPPIDPRLLRLQQGQDAPVDMTPGWVKSVNEFLPSNTAPGGTGVIDFGETFRLPTTKTELALELAGALPAGKIIGKGVKALKTAKAARMVTLSEIGKAPPVPKGMVRLYRGQRGELKPVLEDPPLYETERGRWYSTDPEVADWYGDRYYVDVPEAVSHESWVPDALFNKTGRLIPPEWANKAKRHK